DRLPVRRVPPARTDGAAPRAARGGRPRPGAERAHRGDPPVDRGPGHVRRRRLAPHRLLRPSARRGGAPHLDGQPAPVLGRPSPSGSAVERSLLDGSAPALDGAARLVRPAVPDRPRDSRLIRQSPVALPTGCRSPGARSHLAASYWGDDVVRPMAWLPG